MPKVYNVKHGNWPKGAIYCGRGSPYGNNFRIGVHGDRNKCCDLFELIQLPKMDVSALRGCDLLCHCVPERCHCTPILEKANA